MKDDDARDAIHCLAERIRVLEDIAKKFPRKYLEGVWPAPDFEVIPTMDKALGILKKGSR